jgi:adenine-specific DNA-methyltransferase
MGSKDKLLPFLSDCLDHFINDCAQDLSPKTLLDAFAGSGRVSFHFKDKFNIISNDKLHFSKTIISAYLNTPFDVNGRCADLIHRLNNIPLEYFDHTDKWYTNTYGGDWNNGVSEDDNGRKKVWLTKNSVKIDMIRQKISDWKKLGEINDAEENVLILSLVLAINKVSNVVGHQNGYLKNWATATKRDLLLTIPQIEPTLNSPHKQYVGDIYDTLKHVTADIAYFDPPYGTNNKNLSVATRYSSFYHLWNTLTTNDRPEVFGKASKPISTRGYTEPLERNKREVVIPKFIRLIEETRAPIVAFSYSNKSLLTAKDFEEVYRLAGCDMKTFRLYITSHEVNNQTQLANKGGEWVNRANPNSPLTEYLFIACRDIKNKKRTTGINITSDVECIEEVNDWLSKEECFSLPSNTFEYYNKNITNFNDIHSHILPL